VPEKVEINCPGCERGLRVREEYLGHKLQCRYCGQSFIARRPATESSSHVIPWPEAALREMGVAPDAPEEASPQRPAESVPLENLSQPVGDGSGSERASISAPAPGAHEELERITQERDDARRDLQRARVELSSIEDRVELFDELENRLKTAEAKASSRKTELREARDETATAIEQRNAFRTELDRVCLELTESQRSLEQLRTQLDNQTSRKSEEHEATRSEVETVRTHLSTAISERDTAHTQRESLEAALKSERESHQREKSEILTAAESRLSEAQDVQNRLYQTERAQWETERAALLERLNRSEKALTESAQAVEDREKARAASQAAYDALAAEVASHREAAETAAAERDLSSADRDHSLAELQALQNERESMAGRLDALEEAARVSEGRFGAEVARISAERDEAKAQAEALADKFQKAEADLAQAHGELAAARSAKEHYDHETEQIRAGLQHALDEARSQVEAATERATRSEEWARIATARVAAIEAELTAVRQATANMPATRNGADATDSNDSARKIDQLTSQLREARQDAEHLRSMLVNLGIKLY
jgi:chromosome segregation ATPase